jgi:putative ABC transport system permease protein
VSETPTLQPHHQREPSRAIYGGEPTRLETLSLDKVRRELPSALDQLKTLNPEEKEALRQAVQAPPARTDDVLQETVTIVGAVRLPTEEETSGRWDPLQAHGDLVLPIEAATNLFFRMPGPGEHSVHQAIVFVDRQEHVKEVAQQIRAMGLQPHVLLEFIERERLMYLLIFGAMTCVAAVAMVVAALGIANTMLMSVLERTREIGVMKAVGAGNGQLQLIFLVEGALIGLVGGALGLALGWGLSFPADDWLRSMVSRDLKIELKESIFVFPPWMQASVMAFSLLVTIMAALYPARRAARVDPVTALRHE